MTSASIVVRDLTKAYGDVLALDRLSFEIQPGEIVGFLGPNGAGKSTSMKILTCFLAANSGEAMVAGFDVYSDSKEVRKRVGYLAETNPLYEDMIVLDYLNFIAQIRRIPGRKRRQRIEEVSDQCGIRHVLHRDIKHLSKGYKQRVGLAQAILHSPEVLILDEPTSGLDPNQIVEIRDLIKELGTEKTVILSTHILQEVTAVCDRILIIDKGKLVADGSLQDLAHKLHRPQILKLVIDLADVSTHTIRRELKAIRGVTKVSGNGGVFDIVAKHNIEVTTHIYELLVSRGWTLRELSRREPTLEDIFRGFTGGVAPEDAIVEPDDFDSSTDAEQKASDPVDEDALSDADAEDTEEDQ